jgi:hypothetical protein
VSRYGVPQKALMLALRDALGISRFLETGTHRGTTAAWAAEHFAQVITIEASEQLYREAVARHGQLGNVRFVLGDTRTVLAGELERLGGPAVVWLDSHWCGDETHRAGGECPVLDEIAAVRASPHEHVVFVDDARYFLAPPPRPHRMEDWPTLAEVIAALTEGERPLDVVVLDDAFVAVPTAAGQIVRACAQEAATRALERREASPSEESLSAHAARQLRRAAGRLRARLLRREPYPPRP